MTTWLGDQQPQPYPDDTGVKMRILHGPVKSPEGEPPDPPKVKRASGGECDPMATIGERRPRGPVAPDDRVPWYEWPPP